LSNHSHIPTYRKHKASGQAIVTLTDGLGNRRDVLLGKYGSKESRADYARVLAEWEANGRLLPSAVAADITVAELVDRFWPHVETHYRHADGSPTGEVKEYKYSFRPLVHLYGGTPARNFGPLSFKAVRQLMIDGYNHPRHGQQMPLARGVVNQRAGRIRRMFKWSVENELVPPSVYHGLLAVQGLQRGRTRAREPEPVRPVPDAHVNAVRPYVSRQVEAMIDLQLLTGMRPGEVCIMRACDLDTTARIWVYRPHVHKTSHHGHGREVYLGPRAQEVVKRFLKTDLQAYLFSPGEAREERFLALRQNRKSKVQPSQVCRRRNKPKKVPGERYDVFSYRRAIAYACDRAFQVPEGLMEAEARKWRKAHRWHPHQLRHNAGTNVRKKHGIELARIILGHSTAFCTEIYAEADRQQAMEVVAKIG
jgi:integrase